jgi:hypothetical protein
LFVNNLSQKRVANNSSDPCGRLPGQAGFTPRHYSDDAPKNALEEIRLQALDPRLQVSS